MTREELLKANPQLTEDQITKALEYYNDPLYKAKGIARSAAQGVTFGFADEMTALAQSLFGRDYEELVTEERKKLNEFRASNPALAYGMEIGAGFLIPGAGWVGGAIKAGKTGLTAAKGAGIGAGQGALYGAGVGEGSILSAEGLASRGGGATLGASTGAALGATLPKVFRGIASGGSWTARKLRGLADSLFVNRQFAREGKKINADLRSVQEKLEAKFREQLKIDNPELLRQYDKAGVPASEAYRSQVTKMGQHATLADLPEMQGLVAGATQGYSGVRNMAREAFKVRAEKEARLILDEAEEIMRATSNSTEMVNRIKAIVERRAAPLYEKGGTELDKDLFSHVLDDKLTRSLWNQTRAYVNSQVRRGEYSKNNEMPSWNDLADMDTVRSEWMHQLRIHFGKKTSFEKQNKSVKTAHYEGLWKDMGDVLKDNVPFYKEASKVYKIGQNVEKWDHESLGLTRAPAQLAWFKASPRPGACRSKGLAVAP